MINPIIPILTSVAGFAIGAAISHIITKDRCEKEAAVRIAAMREEYKKQYAETEEDEAEDEAEEDEAPPQNTPESVIAKEREASGIFTKHDPHAVQYAQGICQDAGYFPSNLYDSEQGKPNLPYIIDEDEFDKHNCPNMRLDWYPEVSALIVAEGEDAGSPVIHRNFTVGDHNLDKMVPGENDFIIVHNPTQDYDYEIFMYMGQPNYNRYVNASPFGGDPDNEDGE